MTVISPPTCTTACRNPSGYMYNSYGGTYSNCWFRVAAPTKGRLGQGIKFTRSASWSTIHCRIRIPVQPRDQWGAGGWGYWETERGVLLCVWLTIEILFSHKITDAFSSTLQFFQLPLETKKTYLRTSKTDNCGYVQLEQERWGLWVWGSITHAHACMHALH